MSVAAAGPPVAPRSLSATSGSISRATSGAIFTGLSPATLRKLASTDVACLLSTAMRSSSQTMSPLVQSSGASRTGKAFALIWSEIFASTASDTVAHSAMPTTLSSAGAAPSAGLVFFAMATRSRSSGVTKR